MKTKNDGFTLLELIITISLMGIFASFAVPSMTNILARHQLNSDMRSLIAAMTQARHQAIFLRKNAKINFVAGTSDETNFYWQPYYNSQVTTPTTLTPITFRKDGTLLSASNDLNFKICNTKLNAAKSFVLTKGGSIFFLSDGACS